MKSNLSLAKNHVENDLGFTMIELLVVILIISILSSFGFVFFAPILNKCSVNQNRCIGQYPNKKELGCEKDAQDAAEGFYKGIRVELRYSPYCQMYWIRSNAPVGSKIYVLDADERKYGFGVMQDPRIVRSYNQFGPMGPRHVKLACIEIPRKAERFCVGEKEYQYSRNR